MRLREFLSGRETLLDGVISCFSLTNIMFYRWWTGIYYVCQILDTAIPSRKRRIIVINTWKPMTLDACIQGGLWKKMKNHKILHFCTLITKGIYDKVSENHKIFHYFSLKFRYSALAVGTFLICEKCNFCVFSEIPLRNGCFNLQIMIVFNKNQTWNIVSCPWIQNSCFLENMKSR